VGLKYQLRRVFRKLGYNVRAKQPFDNEYEILVSIAKRADTALVLDVGANSGTFALELLRAGYAGRVVSFEPLPDAHAALVKRASKFASWCVAPPMAIGELEGRASFFVAGNSSSSSLLSMEALHVSVAPSSRTVSMIQVDVARLDRAALPFIQGSVDIFLKIDTQGSEKSVIKSAAGILNKVKIIRAELSFVSLYAHQEIFDQMFPYIRSLGFDLWEITPVLRNPESGKVLQCDATFVRTENALA
jgi:FkbM family methyltransferase